jgi:gluconolactonase
MNELVYSTCRFAFLVMIATTATVAGEAQVADATGPVSGAMIVRLDKALDALLAPGTEIEKIASGFKFAEGPMWREGRLWVSDVVGDKIFAVSPTGKVELLVEKAGGYLDPPPGKYLGPNAMVTDKDGTVILAQQGGRKIMRIVGPVKDDSPNNGQLKLSLFLDTFESKKFNSPNDLVFAPDGSLWFTDPSYGLAGGDKDPSKEIPFNGVYRYANGRLTAAIKDLTLPNGLGFSPDGKTLYVCNSGPKMAVHQYRVAPDGSLTEGPILIAFADGSGPGVPDGMKVDSAGNIWTTAPGGIRIIAPNGKVLGQIKLPETAANLAWADAGKTLYITAQTSVYRLKVATIGMMPLYRK